MVDGTLWRSFRCTGIGDEFREMTTAALTPTGLLLLVSVLICVEDAFLSNSKPWV